MLDRRFRSLLTAAVLMSASSGARSVVSTFRRSTAIRISSPRRRSSATTFSARSHRSQLQQLLLRIAERVLYRCPTRAPAPARPAPLRVPAVEPACRFQSSLHHRSRHQGGDDGERLRGGRLRSGVAMCSTAAVLVDALAHVRTVHVRGRLRWRARDRHRVRQRRSGTVAHRRSGRSPTTSSERRQQDHWSGGGSRGPVTAFTFDGGGTWTESGGADVPLQRRHSGQWRRFRAGIGYRG